MLISKDRVFSGYTQYEHNLANKKGSSKILAARHAAGKYVNYDSGSVNKSKYYFYEKNGKLLQLELVSFGIAMQIGDDISFSINNRK
jgi:hypothetical protein